MSKRLAEFSAVVLTAITLSGCGSKAPSTSDHLANIPPEKPRIALTVDPKDSYSASDEAGFSGNLLKLCSPEQSEIEGIIEKYYDPDQQAIVQAEMKDKKDPVDPIEHAQFDAKIGTPSMAINALAVARGSCAWTSDDILIIASAAAQGAANRNLRNEPGLAKEYEDLADELWPYTKLTPGEIQKHKDFFKGNGSAHGL